MGTNLDADFDEINSWRHRVLYCMQVHMSRYDAAASRSRTVALPPEWSTPARRVWLWCYFSNRRYDWGKVETLTLFRMGDLATEDSKVRELLAKRRPAKDPVLATLDKSENEEMSPEDIAFAEQLADMMVPCARLRKVNRWLDTYTFSSQKIM